MAGLGFQVYKRAAAGADVKEKMPSVASTQYINGSMLANIAGFGALAGATSKGTHVYEAMITPDSVFQQAVADKSTVLCENILATPVAGRGTILKSWLVLDAVPPINGVACNSNTNKALAKVTAAGTDDDYNPGTIYIPETGEQRVITADAVSGGVHTFTVDPPFLIAPTTTHTAVVVPWSKGCSAVKFNATSPSQCLSTAVADVSGGHNKIEDVDLKGDNFGPFVLSSCPDLV